MDKDKGKKLEPHWEGPYLVKRISHSDVSVTIKDLHTDKEKGRYSFDHVKIYVPLELSGWGDGGERNTVALKDVRFQPS